MPDKASHATLLGELFYEQEHHSLSLSYTHGWLRTAFVVSRALCSRRDSAAADVQIRSGSSVAVVFFANELAAVQHAQAVMHIDQILTLDLRSLPLVRAQLGLAATCAEILYFLRLVVRLKGMAYLRRCSIPLLGWLLYRTFLRLLRDKSQVTVITTNMVHPTSVGVHWAALQAGQHTAFFEHATTPTLIANNRGYDGVYVNFGHTRQMLIAKGFSPEKVHVLRNLDEVANAPIPAQVRTAAICINSYDPLTTLVEATEILQRHGVAVIYRVHDADPRVKDISELARQRGAEISLAKRARIQDFLQQIDLVLSGNSNVIADALIARRPVIYYWSGSSDLYDYYGFVEHYSLPHATSRHGLETLIDELIGQPRPC